MKRKSIQIISIFLTLSVLISSYTVFTYAANANDKQQVYEKIEQSLQFATSEDDLHNLNSVDVSNLYVGLCIPAYEVVNGKINAINIEYYPVLDSENRPVIMAAAYHINEEVVVSLSDIFVSYLDSLDSNDELAFIYGNSGVYLLKNNTVIKMADNDDDVGQHRDDVISYDSSKFSTLHAVPLKKNTKLTINQLIQPFGEDDESIYLNVPIVLQPKNSDICWAAGVASIVNFTFGRSYTAERVAEIFGCKTALGMDAIIDGMNSNFAMGYGYGTYKDGQKNVWASLCKNYPVIGGFLYSTGGVGHIMVIRGMHYNYSFSVMDPLDENNKYRVGQISRSGNSTVFTILSWTGGDVMVLGEYGYKAS